MYKQLTTSNGSIYDLLFIVEENLVKHESLYFTLEAHGLDVTVVKKTNEFLSVLEKGKTDVVLLHMECADLNDFKLSQTITADQPVVHAPVLFVMAVTNGNKKIIASHAEADDFPVTPIVSDELARRLWNAVMKKQRLDSLQQNDCEHLDLQTWLSDLSNMLALDMRGFLQAILANAELLKMQSAHELNCKSVKTLNRIERNCQSLVDLIEDSRS